MRSALVTGGYGFIGSALVRGLLERDVEVTVLRRDASSRSALVMENIEASISVVSGDVTHGPLVERAIADHQVDTVFHLAAQTLVGTARRSPLENGRSTWAALGPCSRLVGVLMCSGWWWPPRTPLSSRAIRMRRARPRRT